MDWQQIAAIFVVALAAFLLVGREIRVRRRARLRACGSDCGCASPPADVKTTPVTEQQTA
jgi:hypothetical protein